ncbi:MAG: GAF domain-containing protein [Clostridia bacterium]|nr:GAF domain-containing protein [Clostridia bacterium]
MEELRFGISPEVLPGVIPDRLQGYIATLERKVREFTFLNEVSRKLLSSYDVDGVLKEALEMALVLTRSEGGCIAILDKPKDKIGEIIWAGQVYLSLKQFLSTERAFFSNFAAYGRIAKVKPGDPVLGRLQQFQPSIRSALALPLQERGQVLGVIMVMHLHDKEADHGVIYDAEDMRTLDLFGQQAAMLIEHTKLKYDAGRCLLTGRPWPPW